MKKLTIMIKKVLVTVLSALLFLSILSIGASPVSAATVPASITLSTDSLNHNSLLQLTVNYDSDSNTIANGDTIVLSIDNSASSLISIAGFSDATATIYGEDGGTAFPVGTRTYTNTGGNYTLTLAFDDGYTNRYGGTRTGITGYYTASVWVSYKNASTTDGSDTIHFSINGVTVPVSVTYSPGAGVGTGNFFEVGSVIGKSGRQGATSGNLGDMPSNNGEDISTFDIMRWSVEIGTQNLCLRDLRANNLATGTPLYWTTGDSIAFSNANSSGLNYNNSNDPYLSTVSDFLRNTDEPFQMNDVVFEDFCDFGEDMGFGYGIGSPHDYVRDSLRIIRIIGRPANNASYRSYLIDSSFLQPIGTDDPVDRFLPSQYQDQRGLTVEEFYIQLKSEGQFGTYTNWEDIIRFDYARSETYNGNTNKFAFDQTQMVPHLKLQLGDLHFDGSIRTIIGTYPTTSGPTDFPVDFDYISIDARNLPYAYLIYYDTEVTDAWLYKNPDNGSMQFRFFNTSKLTYNGRNGGGMSNPLWAAYEGSGGFATPTSLSIKKVDESGDPLDGVEFTLTKPDGGAVVRTTTINGTIQFPINSTGSYTLEETDTPLGFKPMEPITFNVANTTVPIDLTTYTTDSIISYDGETKANTIVNEVNGGTSPSEPAELTLRGTKTLTDHADGSDITVDAGQFSFQLEIEDNPGDGASWDGSNPVWVSAGGDIEFGTFTFTKEGTYEIAVSEDNLDEDGYGYDNDVILVIVEVEDNQGQLVATPSYFAHHGTVISEISFKNTYWQGAVTMPLEGVKKLTNPRNPATTQPIAAEEFSFTLEPDTSSDAGDPLAWAWSGENPVDVLHGGDINFGTLTFGEVGTYVFTLKEVLPSPIPTDWEYDTEEVTVTVKVEEIAPGELKITDVAYEKDGMPVDGILFENTHAFAEGVHVPIDVSKSANASMQAGQFTFSLYASNVSRSQGARLQTATNASAGTSSAVEFDALYFDTPGIYHYLLGETGGSSARWSIDPTRYAIEITITDDPRYGYLQYEVRYEKRVDGVWEESEAPTFHNTYTPPRYNPDDDSSGTGDTGGGTPTPPTGTVIVTPPAADPVRTELTDEGSQSTVQVVEDTGGQQPYLQGGRNHDEPPMATIQGHELVQDGDGYLEFDDNGVALGRWSWDDGEEQWIYDEFPPLASLPPTGDDSIPTSYSLIIGFTIVAIAMMLFRRKAYEARH